MEKASYIDFKSALINILGGDKGQVSSEVLYNGLLQ